MTEYVVCPACGTRIKAGRGHCLRCFEPLPAPGTVPPPSILTSLGWSRDKQLIVGAAAALAALALLVIIWQTAPEPPDGAAQDVPVQSRAATAPASTAPAAAPSATVETRPEPSRPPNGDEPFLDRPHGTADGDGVRYQELVEHFRLGRAAADGYQWTRAIDEYGAAARLSPGDAAAQYNLALALHRRGDERDAIAMFQKAIALAPDDAVFRMPLAAAFENVKQRADAVREYRAFLAAAPNAPEAERARERIEALSVGDSGAAAIR